MIKLNVDKKVFQAPCTLLENKSTYGCQRAELNLFETQVVAHDFPLLFPDPVVVSMISGKKVMYLPDHQPFDFFPGQTIIMPQNEPMRIDFPLAETHNPTKCLALRISTDFLKQKLDELNYTLFRVEESDNLDWTDASSLIVNNELISDTINRLIKYFTENFIQKDKLVEVALEELLLQMLNAKAQKEILLNSHQHAHNHRLAFVVEYIKNHLDDQIPMDKLADKACLSRSQFFRVFQNELGITPTRYINQLRIQKAKRILEQKGKSVTDACYESGFNNMNYFCLTFKQFEGLTPGSFQKAILSQPLEQY